MSVRVRETSDSKHGAAALIVGASGQVGRQLASAAARRSLAWQGTSHSFVESGLRQLDIRDPSQVTEVVADCRPALVFVPAASTWVDGCELEPDPAYETNVLGVAHVVNAANAVGATVVYFSTDYVFDGLGGPYDESAPANPISRYGVQKLIAEHVVMQHAHDALIVRTTVVYSDEPRAKNFVSRLVHDLRHGREVAVPSDQVGTPTYAPALAEAVFDLLDAGARGVVNVAGKGVIARDEFAREAARVFGEDPDLIRSVLTAELRQPAPRPLRAGLLTARAELLLGRELPSYIDGLRDMAGAALTHASL